MFTIKSGENILSVLSRKGNVLLFSAICAGIVFLFTGCKEEEAPDLPAFPDGSFAENYLKEQTYNHCKYHLKKYQVYSTGANDHYVFFSHPREANCNGWKIKQDGNTLNYNGLFRYYDTVGQLYHKLHKYEFHSLSPLESKKFPYTAKMKLEFTCMNKTYHNDMKYNAGLVWLYDKSDFEDFSKADLQSQFALMWKKPTDRLLLTLLMKKDSTGERKITREVPLRYDADNHCWQWRDRRGRWHQDFVKKSDFDRFDIIAGVNLPRKNLNALLAPKISSNHTIVTSGDGKFLCAGKDKNLLLDCLQYESIFLCPGKNIPVWLEKKQYDDSSKLVTFYNKVTYNREKLTVWQALQILDKYYLAIPDVQDLIWDHVEKELARILKTITDTNYVTKEQKKSYINKFLSNLDKCSNLVTGPRFLKIQEQCRTCLENIEQLEDEE